MKDHPILFSAPMVRAILEGRKTQTRRIIKGVNRGNCMILKKSTKTKMGIETHVLDATKNNLCPYGKPGDLLWVRETWMQETEEGIPTGGIIYKASSNPVQDGDIKLRWKPSIYMPKATTRIWLEITGVRVERLQDITEGDAEAEGVEPWSSNGLDFTSYLNSFEYLWNSLNEKRGFGWVENPWVWVIEFRRVDDAL